MEWRYLGLGKEGGLRAGGVGGGWGVRCLCNLVSHHMNISGAKYNVLLWIFCKGPKQGDGSCEIFLSG